MIKRTLWPAAVLLILSYSVVFAAMPYAPKEVIAVHLGPKNATFDESKFPDIRFYYTPDLVFTQERSSGKPALLVSWLNKKGLRADEAIVLDKDGNVAFKNVLLSFKKIEDAIGQGDLDTMGNVLKRVVEENKSAPYVSDKPFDPSDLSMLGRKFPDFQVANASGEIISMKALLYSDDSPRLVFFYRIPKDHVFKDISDSMKDVTSPLQVLGAVTSQSVQDEYLAILNRFEDDLYCR